MQQQPLAFTLVKTVVSARDEGKVLSPALATAWDLLHTELSPAHRVIASEVQWSPNCQDDLRFVIDGVRKQFEKDPALENEFLAFLAEVEPFGENQKDESVLPVVVSLSSITHPLPAPVGELTFEPTPEEAIVEQTEEVELDDLPEDTSTNADPSNIEPDAPEIAEPQPRVEEAELSIDETPEVNVAEEAIELESAAEVAVASSISDIPEHVEPSIQSSVLEPNTSATLLKYWPLAASAILVSAIALGVWTFSGNPESQEESPELISEPIATDSLEIINTESTDEEPDPEITYSAPSVAILSNEIDSLRSAGDYLAALDQQQELVNRLEQKQSPSRETAQAYSELAILYSTQENNLQAIVEQRKSLGHARQAFVETDPALGRTHLKLATFYAKNKELHMARAHLQQARKIFGQAQELVSPTDLKKTDQVAEQILKAS